MKLFFLLLVFSHQVIASNADIYQQALLLKSNLDNGKHIYKLCASCHLDNAMGKKNGSFPVIATQYKSVIIKQLKDIQNKHRKNPTMYPFSDPKTIGGIQAIADVAGYIQSLPNTGDNGIGSGQNLKQGKNLYLTYCIACHGINALGDDGNVFPKLKSQHYQYLYRQLKWIRDGYRTNANSVMLNLIKPMTDLELSNLADYISRL